MPETLPLFDPPELELKSHLAEKLRTLAARKLFIGGSSWKYSGWLGQIYSPQRYYVRGRFSQKRFEQECLAEYAETFPIVGGDFSFYQFPTADFWRKLFVQVPDQFQFAFKVPEETTASVNQNFLSVDLLKREFLDLLQPYKDKVSVLMFEFPAATRRKDFVQKLGKFLSALPPVFRYGVEVRRPELLEPEYFRALRESGVAHVFNSWAQMPSIQEQMGESEAFTTNFVVTRALLKPGRVYAEAVSLFEPYSEIKEPNAEVRSALRDLLFRAKNRAEPLFMFVNNRLEGFAPGTIAALIDYV